MVEGVFQQPVEKGRPLPMNGGDAKKTWHPNLDSGRKEYLHVCYSRLSQGPLATHRGAKSSTIWLVASGHLLTDLELALPAGAVTQRTSDKDRYSLERR